MSVPSLASIFEPKEAALADLRNGQGGSIAALAAQYLLLDHQAEDLKASLADLTSRRNQAQTLLMTALDQAQLKSVRLETGQLVTCCVKHQYALPPKYQGEERAAALAWLRRVGAGELIEPNIHPGTMTAFLRERAEEGKPISPLIQDTEMRYLSVRKV